MDLREAAVAIVEGGRRLGARGLIAAGEGNLSIRLGDGRIAVTPSGRRKDRLDPGEIVSASATAEDARAAPATASDSRGGLHPSSDLAIHLAVFAARPDIGAVAHAHLPAAMALTLAGEVPDPASLPKTALFIPRLPFVPFATPGSEELAARIATALVEPPAPFADVVLLERHGAVAVGSDLDAAIDRLELVEVLCVAWRDSLLLRAARRLIGAEPSTLD
jgi:L-fuculose-phosphate aldolase